MEAKAAGANVLSAAGSGDCGTAPDGGCGSNCGLSEDDKKYPFPVGGALQPTCVIRANLRNIPKIALSIMIYNPTIRLSVLEYPIVKICFGVPKRLE